MEGFDDLLAPSRDALANPFEDPFSKRSSSPDPWSSFHPADSEAFPETDTSDYLGARSATPTLDTQAFSTTAGFNSYDNADPLESAASPTAYDSDPSSPTFARSPGFRESISTIDEVAVPEKTQSIPASSPPLQESPTSPVSPQLANRLAPAAAPTTVSGHSRTSSASVTSIPVTKTERAFQTPLDQQPSVFERSIAGLSIGGESFGGWQGAQSAFVGADRSANLSRERSDSDDDDDRPILESVRARSKDRAPALGANAPQPSTTPLPRADNGQQPEFKITVDDPQRVGDPIRAYTMYTVHTKTNSPLYSKSAFSVLRRYSDFLWLYETLSLNNPGVVVPPVPEKNPFGRFDQSFVQQRRSALEKCVQKIANHPVLQKDTDLRMFLESDTFALDIKHRKAEIANERGGLMASLGQSIAGPRFYETDEWFDRQKAYLDSLELQLRGLVKAIDLVAKQRSELSAANGEFAQTVADLAASEVGPQLSHSFAGLAEVERKAQDLHNSQSQEDVETVMSTVDEYARLINSVRLAFSSRVRTYHSWQSADNNARRVKQQYESNRAQGRVPTDQLSRSLSVVAEAERKAMEAKQEFDQVSRLVKSEVARFEQERIEDFKNSLEVFLEGMIARQKQLISAWENYQQTLLKRVVPAMQRPQDDSVVVA